MIYDIIIVGAGPAGLSAGIYAARSGAKTLILEKTSAGGQMLETGMIKNYPGFFEISGKDLAKKMKEQAIKAGAEFKTTEVKAISDKNPTRRILNLGLFKASFEHEDESTIIVSTEDGSLETKKLIFAAGDHPRHLDLDNAEDFENISYCATCDGPLYKDKTVVVYGGGNSAAYGAIELAKICKKVHLIHHHDTLKADQVLIDTINKTKNINIHLGEELITLDGSSNILNKIVTRNHNLETAYELDGLFVEIGTEPSSELLNGEVDITKDGYIKTDENCLTSNANIYAVGDVRQKNTRQIVTAAADGAIAATAASLALKQ